MTVSVIVIIKVIVIIIMRLIITNKKIYTYNRPDMLVKL